MRDACEGILDIEPGNGEGSRLSVCIINNRFEKEGMLIASFAGSGTLLLGGEEIVGDGVVGHMSSQYGHQKLVEARHKGDEAEVAGIIGEVLFVAKDGGC